MNSKDVMTALVMISMGIGGCANLPESSLIYGSKQSLGIGLESGPDGNPYSGFNLGYLSVDFAKVPVAVQLDDDNPELALVWGSYCGGDMQGQSACAALFRDRMVAVIDIESLSEISGISRSKAREAVDDAADKLGLRRIASSSTRAAFVLSDKVGINMLGREIASGVITQNPSFAAGVGSDDQVSESISESITESIGADILRKDAFSVFGSFNASAEASSANLGKVFATGVAAQTVAESAAAFAKSKCLEAAKSNSLSPEQVIEMCD